LLSLPARFYRYSTIGAMPRLFAARRNIMSRARRLMFATLLLIFSLNVAQAQTTPARPQEQAYVIEYYYKTRWGYADEFLRLFKKNHLPVLKKQVEMGRILNVKIEKPRYHATEDGRWDFRVTIAFKNAAAFHEPNGEEAIIKQLYPDQTAFQNEERRRFEILLAHWDVPLVSVD
jgi:hypothetical protein